MRVHYTLSRSFLLRTSLVVAALCLPSNGWCGVAQCFMHGIITPLVDTKEKPTLSDMLRLHFDVSKPEDKAKCEQMMESYCIHNVLKKEYNPVLLKGSFRPNSDKTDDTAYRFTEKCKLLTD